MRHLTPAPDRGPLPYDLIHLVEREGLAGTPVGSWTPTRFNCPIGWEILTVRESRRALAVRTLTLATSKERNGFE
jgi:hypothetical protein